MPRDWLLYLDDLIDAAEKIGRFVKHRTFDEFTADETRLDTVLFNLRGIGEAVKHPPEAARAAMPEIDWPKAARLKGIIAHHYFALEPTLSGTWRSTTRLRSWPPPSL